MSRGVVKIFPAQQRFLDAVKRSRTQKTVVDVVFNGAVVATSLPITDGSVTVDRSSSVRRTCNLTVADPNFVPTYVNSALSPYGTELKVYSGFQYDDGTTDLCPLGIFAVDTVNWEESGGSLPQVQSFDRSQKVTDAKLLLARDFSGHSAMGAITSLVNEVVKCDVTFDDALIDITMPGGSVYDNDRWQTCQDIAKALAAEVFFDVFGNVVVIPVPKLSTSNTVDDAVWTMAVGVDGTLSEAKRGVSRRDIYNCIIMQGTGTSSTSLAPIGYAADTDPRSPTYWGPATALPNGPFVPTTFGQSNLRLTSNLLLTPDQCQAAATAQLANYLGRAKSLNFTCAPNTALDVGDIILARFLDGSQELHIVDSLSIPLGGGGKFSGTTRTLTYQVV